MPSRLLLALDMMDTVVRDPIFREVPRLLGRSIEQVFQLLDGRAWVEFETGVIDEQTYLQRMFSNAPPPGITSHDVRDTIIGSYRFVDGMEQLLGELRGAGVRIWGLSNYSPWMAEIRQQLELDRFFQGCVLSYEIGHRKPDPHIYRSLLRQAGIPADQCLFVDDRQPNVEAARALGIHGVVFQSALQLRGDLTKHGVVIGP